MALASGSGDGPMCVAARERKRVEEKAKVGSLPGRPIIGRVIVIVVISIVIDIVIIRHFGPSQAVGLDGPMDEQQGPPPTSPSIKQDIRHRRVTGPRERERETVSSPLNQSPKGNGRRKRGWRKGQQEEGTGRGAQDGVGGV